MENISEGNSLRKGNFNCKVASTTEIFLIITLIRNLTSIVTKETLMVTMKSGLKRHKIQLNKRIKVKCLLK